VDEIIPSGDLVHEGPFQHSKPLSPTAEKGVRSKEEFPDMHVNHSPSPATPGVEDAVDDPRKPATPLFFVLYTLAMFGIWMAVNLPATVTIALRVSALDPKNTTTSYSIIAGVGAAAAIFATPLFGRLSDRTRSRWGRRRPWVVIGLLGTTAGATLIAFTNSLPMLFVGWIVMQCFVNAANAGLLAVVADRFPERQHGLLGSISGTTGTLSVMVGTFLIAWFPTQILPQIGLPMLFALVAVGLLLPVMKEDDSRGMDFGQLKLRELLGSFVIHPRKSPDFALFLLVAFLLFLGTVGLGTYHVYYMQNVIGIPSKELPSTLVVWGILNGVASLIASPLAGWFVDRTARVKIAFAVAGFLGAASVVFIVFSRSINVFYIGSTLEGLSFGIMLGTYFVFATSTMNDPSTIARDLGITNFAITAPYSVVPLVAPLILGIGAGAGQANYALLFILGGIANLIAIPTMLKIRTSLDKRRDVLAKVGEPIAENS
jgi:Na+/melibiose symporter and related transporters